MVNAFVIEYLNNACFDLDKRLKKVKERDEILWLLKPLAETTHEEVDNYLKVSTEERMEVSRKNQDEIILISDAIQEITMMLYSYNHRHKD